MMSRRDSASILLVSARAGAGHLRAAEALRCAFAVERPAVRVEHVDVLELAPRRVRTAYADGFEWIAARAPRVWRQMYKRTNGPGPAPQRWGSMAGRTLFRAFRRLLEAEPWAMVVCTHFLPPQLAGSRRGLPPSATVVTDFTLHRYWVQPGVRRYFVPTPALARLVERQIPGARVLATGIPVDPVFAAAPSRVEARQQLGVDPCRPTVLVMGEGLGKPPPRSARRVWTSCRCWRYVAEIPRHASGCGRWAFPRNGCGCGDSSCRMEQFLAAADAVIGKPGGLSSSETLAVGRPLILTRPIAGQEEGNIRARVRRGGYDRVPALRDNS